MEPILISDLDELQKYAEALLNDLLKEPKDKALLVTLSGELGAGKTAFVQMMGKLLGISSTMPSPTFAICRKYQTNNGPFKNVIHMDAYRLKSSEELRAVDFDTLLKTPNTVIFLEWPENVLNALPREHFAIQMFHNEEKREFKYEKRK